MKSTEPCDPSQIQRFLSFLHPDPGSVFELRILRPQRPYSVGWEGSGRTPLGFYRDKGRAVEHALRVDGDGEVNPSGIYVTLNPVSNDLLSRANERLRGGVNGSSDDDALCFQNLLIDLDPVRRSWINTTEEEHQAAIDLAETIRDSLAGLGWPEPYLGSSGNGAVLIYRLPSVPNDQCSGQIVRNVLAALASHFETETVKIDQEGRQPFKDRQAAWHPEPERRQHGRPPARIC